MKGPEIDFSSLTKEPVVWDKRSLENDDLLMDQLHTLGGIVASLEPHLARRIIEEDQAKETYNMDYHVAKEKYLEVCKHNEVKPPKTVEELKYAVFSHEPAIQELWGTYTVAKNKRLGVEARKNQFLTAYNTLSRVVALKEKRNERAYHG